MMVLVSIGKSVLSGKDVKFMQMDNLHPIYIAPIPNLVIVFLFGFFFKSQNTGFLAWLPCSQMVQQHKEVCAAERPTIKKSIL